MPPATLLSSPCTASETASEATLSSATSDVDGMPRLCATDDYRDDVAEDAQSA